VEIKILKNGYKNNELFYKDFLDDKIKNKEEYFSGVIHYIDEVPNFPIYIGSRNETERKALFLQAFNIISKYYLKTERDKHLDEVFWHSLFSVYKRDFLLEVYPEIKDDISKFNNIVLKSFNWENYIYKCVLGAEYINDNAISELEKQRYYELIINNLDLYNYIIKYEIFRNDKFLINMLDIVDELNLSEIMKSSIEGRPDLGKDERVGRRVIFEFNKSYPIIMSPMMEIINWRWHFSVTSIEDILYLIKKNV